jgi:nitrate/nitrite transport system substrate-binding protein
MTVQAIRGAKGRQQHMTKSETNKPGRKISRRQLLKAGAGTAALLAAAKLNFPAGAFAQDALVLK